MTRGPMWVASPSSQGTFILSISPTHRRFPALVAGLSTNADVARGEPQSVVGVLGETPYDSKADVNGDGMVDEIDLAILASSWHSQGPSPTPTLSPTVTPTYFVPADNAPVIYSSPVTKAWVGQVYQYQVSAYDPDSTNLVFSLGGAPAGMKIGASGLITWVPTSSQAGNNHVTLLVGDGVNTVDQGFTVSVTQTTVAGSEYINHNQDEYVEVTDPNSHIYSTRLAIPANTLPSDAPVSLDDVTGFSDAPADVRLIGISGTRNSVGGMTIEVPIFQTLLERYKITDVEEINLYGFNQSLGEWIQLQQMGKPQLLSKADPRFAKAGITAVIAGVIHNDVTIVAAITKKIFQLRVQPEGLRDGSNGLIAAKGSVQDFWTTSGKKLLVVHGVLSDAMAFDLSLDFVRDPRVQSYYDVIVMYQYRSGELIGNVYNPRSDSNGQQLYSFFQQAYQKWALQQYGQGFIPPIADAPWPMKTDRVDVLAHSMGGLVVRFALENAGSGKNSLDSVIDHVVTIQTPHAGSYLYSLLDLYQFQIQLTTLPSLASIAVALIDAGFPGIAQTSPESPLFSNTAQLGLNDAFTYDGTPEYIVLGSR